ncbi:serine-rich adhesin for platelets [Uranotaenia lowii]|uniref:serine-rich adhesin for platelets n=1 Tax=Uranotaenia lowii TaxID=190385 RepID=UPI00247A78D1|nr:serine-rich adhesin for platelets [Uranotaenia lowii]
MNETDQCVQRTSSPTLQVPPPSTSSSEDNLNGIGVPDQADFNQWLHAMKMVAQLPGGIPSEFRRKLWLTLSKRYVQENGINWDEIAETYLTDQWDADDEELGIQIVKDLHRTGFSLCSGPSGTTNQAKLKRVLLGYSRFNPEVGYCQGFNMLGALILQVMDKNEIDSIRVMILLIEGLLPAGYFCGSLGGLQTDMAVFRDLLGTKLPVLAQHLHKIQGPEAAFEPPLTNVFTMQWFLTIFCTCLPLTSVLRIWDLILIEGSDILLRTALAIWGLLEQKILTTKNADEFYCKMETLSAELVNGNLVDCDNLIQRIVKVGPITSLQQLRDKHKQNITQIKEASNIKIFYSDDDGESDEDSRLAVTATAWGLRSERRSSLNIPTNVKSLSEERDKVNIDISLLKKQYDKLKERQRQAHIIITAAVARQPVIPVQNSSVQLNKLLIGKNALLSNKGKRLGPPIGAVPPVRISKGSKQSKSCTIKSPKPADTIFWNDLDGHKTQSSKKQQEGQKTELKEATSGDHGKLNRSSSASSMTSNVSETATTSKAFKRRSESSSYSDESDEESSSSTSLCDDENQAQSISSLEASPMKKRLTPDNIKEVPEEQIGVEHDTETFNYFQFDALVDTSSIGRKNLSPLYEDITFEEKSNSNCQVDVAKQYSDENTDNLISFSENISSINLKVAAQSETVDKIGDHTISPLNFYLNDIPGIMKNVHSEDPDSSSTFEVNEEEGVTNQLFERINAAQRPNYLNLNVMKELEISSSCIKSTAENLSEKESVLNDYIIPSETSLDFSFRRKKEEKNTFSLSPSMETVQSENLLVETALKKDMQNDLYNIPLNCVSGSLDSSLVSNIKFMKEKSFSMDEPLKTDELFFDDISKRSSSEGFVSVEVNADKNSKMSEIIKENSLILGRLVKKSNNDRDENVSVKLPEIQKEDKKSNVVKPHQEVSDLSAEPKIQIESDQTTATKEVERETFYLDTAILTSDLKLDEDGDHPNQTVSKTDLLIKRTEEQLARFNNEESASFFSSQYILESVSSPEHEKQIDGTRFLEEKLEATVPSLDAVKTFQSEDRLDQSNQLLEKVTCNSEIQISETNFAEIDKDCFIKQNESMSTKTDELIKKTEEQLARFENSDRKELEKLETRLSLIEFKFDHNNTDELLNVSSQQRILNRTEEVIKKSQEQISRIKIDSVSISKNFSCSSLSETYSTKVTMPVTFSSKTEDIIKKTDEQLAKFKKVARINAEKRKSRHEIEELLQTKNESPTFASNHSNENFMTVHGNDLKKSTEEPGYFKIGEKMQASKTDEIIKKIGDGKIKLGDDYITTIKTIDYLKQSNANLSATLSSIENSIKTIDCLCDHDSDIQSNRINNTIENLEKSLKQFDNASLNLPPLVMVHDFSNSHCDQRCRPSTCNRPSRSRKRKEYSPKRKKEKDRNDKNRSLSLRLMKDEKSPDSYLSDHESQKSYTFHSFYSTSPPNTPRVVSPVGKRSTNTLQNTQLHEPKQPISFKSLESPLSPIINRSYLESLRPAIPISSTQRISRSAENSPPCYSPQIFKFPTSDSSSKHAFPSLSLSGSQKSEKNHVKSCENILMRIDCKNITALASSFPVSSGLTPSMNVCKRFEIEERSTSSFEVCQTQRLN